MSSTKCFWQPGRCCCLWQAGRGLAGSADAQGDRHCLAFTHISALLFPSVSSYTASRCQCLPVGIKCWRRELWQGQTCGLASLLHALALHFISLYINLSSTGPTVLSVFCLLLEFGRKRWKLLWLKSQKKKKKKVLACHMTSVCATHVQCSFFFLSLQHWFQTDNIEEWRSPNHLVLMRKVNIRTKALILRLMTAAIFCFPSASRISFVLDGKRKRHLREVVKEMKTMREKHGAPSVCLTIKPTLTHTFCWFQFGLNGVFVFLFFYKAILIRSLFITGGVCCRRALMSREQPNLWNSW